MLAKRNNFFNLWDFDNMFPKYYDMGRIPIWFESENDQDNYVIKVMAPGYEKEDFLFYIQDGLLYLEIKNENKDLKYVIADYRCIPDKAEATYRNGVLKITVPKLGKGEKKMLRVL